MCVSVSRQMKSGETAKRVVDFPLERDTFRNKIMEIVTEFDEKSYNNNGKPWKSSTILRVKPIFSFFFLFASFFSIFSFFFFHFFIFFIFSLFLSFSFIFFHFLSFFFISFHFLSFSIIFFHFLSFSFIFHFPSFSFIFFHLLSFSFIFFVFDGCSKSDFFCASISLRFLLTILV